METTAKGTRIVHDVDVTPENVAKEFAELRDLKPAVALMGVRVHDLLMDSVKLSEVPGSEDVGSFLGMRVIKSPVLPPGFIIFEDAEGRVVGIIRMKEEK